MTRDAALSTGALSSVTKAAGASQAAAVSNRTGGRSGRRWLRERRRRRQRRLSRMRERPMGDGRRARGAGPRARLESESSQSLRVEELTRVGSRVWIGQLLCGAESVSLSLTQSPSPLLSSPPRCSRSSALCLSPLRLAFLLPRSRLCAPPLTLFAAVVVRLSSSALDGVRATVAVPAALSAFVRLRPPLCPAVSLSAPHLSSGWVSCSSPTWAAAPSTAAPAAAATSRCTTSSCPRPSRAGTAAPSSSATCEQADSQHRRQRTATACADRCCCCCCACAQHQREPGPE